MCRAVFEIFGNFSKSQELSIYILWVKVQLVAGVFEMIFNISIRTPNFLA